MARHDSSPEHVMASLFVGLSRHEQMALLGRLESAGARIYRTLAADEKNAKAREALLKAADREEENGGLLRLMTTPRDKCEKCARSFPRARMRASVRSNAPSARIARAR